MGVNAIILLPPDTRIGDAAEVIGILAGLKVTRDRISCNVKGAKAISTSIAEMAEIKLEGDMVDGERNHSTTWHWEPDDNKTGERLLYPRANTFWIAIGKKLVDFFGGSICYNDCGDHKPNYTAKKPRQANNPSDGEAWDKFQDEIFAVKPLTQSELDEANGVAAYKLERA